MSSSLPSLRANSRGGANGRSSTPGGLIGGPRTPAEWDARAAPAAPPRAASALSSYDALRDGNLRFDMRAGTSTAGRGPAIPKQASVAAFSKLLEQQNAHGPKATGADQRLVAQRLRYDSMARTPADPAGPPPIPIVPKEDPASKVRPEEVFVQARDRLLLLWDTLGIDDGVRAHFVATAFREVSAESIAAMHAEIERLVLLRAREAEVKSAIEIREGLVYVLQDHTERAMATSSSSPVMAGENENHDVVDDEQHRRLSFVPLDPAIAREVRQVVGRLRKASFAVVDAVAAWRRALGYKASYRWRGTSYLLKMQTDLVFVAAVPAVAHAIGTSTVGNPLLDPSANRPQQTITSSTTDPTANNALTTAATAASFRRTASTGRFGGMVATSSSAALKRNGGGGGAGGGGGFSAERYAGAREVLNAEKEVWASARQTSTTYRFDSPDDGDVDVDVVDATINECMFVPPEDYGSGPGGRSRAIKEMQQHLVVVARVVRIQRSVRRMLAVRHAAVVARRNKAVTRIQAIARRIVATNAAERRREQVRSAVRVQALIRGCLTRMGRRTGISDETAALRIQCAFRRHRAQTVVAMHRAVYRAAAKIQSLYRAMKGKQAAQARLVEVQSTAAASVQRIWRGASLRKSGRANPRTLAAALRIQTWYRGWRDRQLAAKMLALNRAARVIQRAVRRRIVAPKRREELRRLHEKKLLK